QFIVRDKPALASELGFTRVRHFKLAKPITLVKTHQMRRDIGVHPFSRSFQDCAHEGDGGALAVGAGDMDHRRHFSLWVIERREQALHAIERQIDTLGMQRGEPREDRVNRLRHDNTIILALTRAPGPAIAAEHPAPESWSTAGIIRPASRAIYAGARPCPPCRAR